MAGQTKLNLLVDVVVKGQKGLVSTLGNDLDTAGKKADTLKTKMKDLFSKKGLAVGGFALATAGIATLTAGIAAAVDSLLRIERITAQTNAAIKSTGGVAGVTADHIIAYS